MVLTPPSVTFLRNALTKQCIAIIIREKQLSSEQRVLFDQCTKEFIVCVDPFEGSRDRGKNLLCPQQQLFIFIRLDELATSCLLLTYEFCFRSIGLMYPTPHKLVDCVTKHMFQHQILWRFQRTRCFCRAKKSIYSTRCDIPKVHRKVAVFFFFVFHLQGCPKPNGRAGGKKIHHRLRHERVQLILRLSCESPPHRHVSCSKKVFKKTQLAYAVIVLTQVRLPQTSAKGGWRQAIGYYLLLRPNATGHLSGSTQVAFIGSVLVGRCVGIYHSPACCFLWGV